MHYRNRWTMLFISFYTIVTLAFIVLLIPPLIPMIMNEFLISHTQASLLMSIVFTPGIFLAIPAGMFVDRYGVRNVGAFSMTMIAFGCFITAISNSFQMVLIGRLVLGIGGIFAMIVMPTMISQWFPHEEMGKAMGIYGMNMPFATMIAFPLASMLMLTSGWRYPFYLGTGLAIVSSIIFVFTAQKGPFKHEHQVMKIRLALNNVEIWKVGAVWSLSFASVMSFITWFPKLFGEFRSMNPFYASLLVSMLMIVGIIFALIYGWISYRIGRRKIFMILSFVIMAAALIAIAHLSETALIVPILALGGAAFMIPPIVLTLPPKILGPATAGTGYSILFTCLMLGITLAPLCIGFIIDVTNSLTLSFMGMALFPVIGAIVAFTLRME